MTKSRGCSGFRKLDRESADSINRLTDCLDLPSVDCHSSRIKQTHSSLDSEYTPRTEVQIPLVETQSTGDLTSSLLDPVERFVAPFHEVLQVRRGRCQARLMEPFVGRRRVGELYRRVMLQDLTWDPRWHRLRHDREVCGRSERCRDSRANGQAGQERREVVAICRCHWIGG